MDVVASRVHWGGWRKGPKRRVTGVVLARETLAQIVPGRTTREALIQLCGPPTEEREQLAAPERRTLVYRGRRVGPTARRVFGWLATVAHWEVEQHEVQIHLVRDVVQDVEAETRRCRLSADERSNRTQ
jgi:hypothetical protein